MKPIHILAIETSCDETAASIVEYSENHVRVLSNVVSSQADLHARFGGVVPDMAAREHTKNIVPVVESCLRESEKGMQDIDALAVTQGPGLIPALLIGTTAAKTLSYVWQKPLLGVHHIEGHIYANFINNAQAPKSNHQKNSVAEDTKEPKFPLLALVVSGGHTQLILMRDHFEYEILGETQDDAAGEAFDKVAKMLGLPYPGGPIVAKRADTFAKTQDSEKETELRFPRPMIQSGDFNFSFSGLKTAVLYTLKKHPDRLHDESFMNEVCYQFQEAVLEVLLSKTHKAVEKFHPKTFVIAGGVSANTELRARLAAMIEKDFPQTRFLTPPFVYSLDNAAMIAAAAAFRWASMSPQEQNTCLGNWKTLRPDASLKLENLRLQC